MLDICLVEGPLQIHRIKLRLAQYLSILSDNSFLLYPSITSDKGVMSENENDPPGCLFYTKCIMLSSSADRMSGASRLVHG